MQKAECNEITEQNKIETRNREIRRRQIKRSWKDACVYCSISKCVNWSIWWAIIMFFVFQHTRFMCLQLCCYLFRTCDKTKRQKSNATVYIQLGDSIGRMRFYIVRKQRENKLKENKWTNEYLMKLFVVQSFIYSFVLLLFFFSFRENCAFRLNVSEHVFDILTHALNSFQLCINCIMYECVWRQFENIFYAFSKTSAVKKNLWRHKKCVAFPRNHTKKNSWYEQNEREKIERASVWLIGIGIVCERANNTQRFSIIHENRLHICRQLDYSLIENQLQFVLFLVGAILQKRLR